jgi:hypothetical protein
MILRLGGKQPQIQQICLWFLMRLDNVEVCTIRIKTCYATVVPQAILSPMVWVMVFNATFNNISAISWWSVLLIEETGVPGENHRPTTSH